MRPLLLPLLIAAATAHAEAPSLRYALPAPGAAATLTLPGVDLDKSLAEDRAAAGKGVPLRYGLASTVETLWVDAHDSQGGEWRTLPDGRLLWRAQVTAPDVRSLDFGFERFRLPAGAELWIVGAGRDNVQGPFTDADNPASGQPFHTPFVVGDSATIELVLPADRRAFVDLRLRSATRAYRDVLQPWAVEKSGSCNVDVACPQGDAWRDQINSVGQYTFSTGGSSYVCTGQLVNNTRSDRAPLFSTANHCVSTAAETASIVVYWKYENPTCRTPGSSASGSPISKPANSIAQTGGAALLATHAASDFTLARLNTTPPAAANPYWSGWDRSGSTPSSAVGIHHPSGHEKRISLENQALSVTAYSGNPGSGSTHWRVADWDVGTTEGGSSGSGLWSPAGLLIGQLHGGSAACGNDLPDWYGRLSVSWTGGGTASTRLSTHLDPDNTGAQTLPGRNSCTAPTVSLSSSAFTTPPSAGDSIVLNATASGGAGAPYTYRWDVDNDGAVDRIQTGTSLTVRYPGRTSTQVRLVVADRNGCEASVSRALDVRGARIEVATQGTPQQLCGNGDAVMNPGERWRLPVTLRNGGNAALGSGAHALFASGRASAAPLPLGPDAFGHRATTTAAGGCGYGWIDLSGQAPLPLSGNDDGRAVIALGGGGLRLYGQQTSSVVMSTNGYVSLSGSDDGGDYSPACDEYSFGDTGPRLQPYHDDFVVRSELPGSGLRYRYFDSCPRAAEAGGAQGCHVFSWSGMGVYTSSGPSGDAEFQAIVYAGSGQVVYQHRRVDPDAGTFAVVGLANADHSDALTLSCQRSGLAASQAYCVFRPDALPGTMPTPLQLATPTVALPQLAVGATANVAVDVAIPTTAACGAPVAVDFLAAANSGSASKASGRAFAGTLAGGSCAVVNSCPSTTEGFTPRAGHYYNPQRAGNGVTGYLFPQADGSTRFGGAWFTAGADRLPLWYTTIGRMDTRSATVDILYNRNAGTANALNVVSTDVGDAWFGFIDAQRVLMAWEFNDGRSGAELMETIPSVQPGNRSAAYWNPAQSGWGIALDTALYNGTPIEFTVDYIYDSAGVPRWVNGVTTNLSPTAVTTALATGPVHCPGCPSFPDFDSLTSPAGSTTRVWNAIGSGTLNTSITLPAPLSGTWNRSNLPIQAMGPVQ